MWFARCEAQGPSPRSSSRGQQDVFAKKQYVLVDGRKGSVYVRMNLILTSDLASPAREPPNEVDRKLYHHVKVEEKCRECEETYSR